MAAELEDEFGDIVAKARRGLGMDANDLAHAAGIGAGMLHEFETYVRKPTEAECQMLAEILDLDSAALWDIADGRWAPAPVSLDLAGRGRIATIPHPPFRVTMYVVGDTQTQQALIVDPGADADGILNAVRQQGWQPVGVLITHADHDHIGALAEIERAHSAPVWLHTDEHIRLKGVTPRKVHLIDSTGDFTVGPFHVRALETPGHSAGHTSFAVRDAVLVGDTLFAGSLGRPSGPATYGAHLKAVRDNILTLPPATKLFAGHGPPTTVGEERAHNPFFASHYRS